MKRVGILASHNGSGFAALYEAAQSKRLNIKIVVLISNNTDSAALSKASRYAIDNFIINTKTDTDPNKKIEQVLNEYRCDFVFLSGYMKKIGANITQNFRVINSHPALLPKYGGKGMYGYFIHEAVIKNKEKYSGVSVHHVNEKYDEGEIIIQKKLRIRENESAAALESRVKELEGHAIVEAFQTLCIS